MTEDQELQAALEKAIALCARVDKLAEELPPEKRGALTALRRSAHSVVGNLGEALRIKKG